ncbi:MAG TPA: hypothetical protein P5513_03340 [Candidatus Diapherotrites archaeon]|nr:hypothetical protein [Candidatus Diapherotrites archaeon]
MELLEQYTIPQIIAFIIGLVAMIKGAWDTIEYFKNKYKRKFNKDYDVKIKETKLEDFYNKTQQRHKEVMAKIDKMSDSVDTLSKRIDKLTESDMHDIKQFIVREHHYFVSKGWIDDYSLDSIMLRYEDYKEEGGNSYIKTLVEEIKALPKQQPPTV